MKPRALSTALLGALLALSACGPSGNPNPPQAAPAGSSATSPGATASPASAGCPGTFGSPPANLSAAVAVALAFAPDGRLFFAERGGTIRVYQGGQTVQFATVPTVTTEALGTYSERGLLGLAISPTFGRDHYVYAFYSETDRAHQRVVRFTDDCQGHGTDEATIVADLPSGADCCHKGGRLAFGPEGDLYVTLGDNHSAAAAQDRCDVRGKVLRYTPEGRPAPGNACGAVFDYGLRNPFGIAFNPDGQLLITNNGPSGDAGSPRTGYDTVYLASAKTEVGVNFGWPSCYGYSHPLAAAACPSGWHPADYSTEAQTIVPTGATWVSSGRYAGHFAFCAYNGGMMRVFTGPQSVGSGPGGCRYDVKQGPDGALYLAGERSITRVAG